MNGALRHQVNLFADPLAASLAAARSLQSLSDDAVAGGRTLSVMLTGGSSPGTLYDLLGRDEWRDRIPWRAVHLFWGDERCVPPGHPRSNFGMARRLLLSRIAIPAENVHRIRGELDPAKASASYAAEMQDFFSGTPRFDLVHLGMGDDGHVCSLFPFAELLKERRATTGVALLGSLGEWRVTVTYPVINAARRVELMVFGAGKRRRLREVLVGARDPLRVPAQGVRPSPGELVLWVDAAAASGDGPRVPEAS